MEEYLGVAKDAGISTSEVEAVKHCVMAVPAGQVNSQVAAVRAGARGGKSEEG